MSARDVRLASAHVPHNADTMHAPNRKSKSFYSHFAYIDEHCNDCLKENVWKLKERLTLTNVIITLVWFAIIITVISTLRLIIAPLLPNQYEYEGSYPENWETNFEKLGNILLRKLVMFNESFSIEWILILLSHIFFLLLLQNIKNVVSKPIKPKELYDKYFGWAASSLLITIVFMSKFINENNITIIALGILGLAVSVFALFYSKIRFLD